MLYEHNSSIEPTSSTLLLQRTPSESGSYTTDEYSYRRTNGGIKQLKTTIERNKKKSKKSSSSNYSNNQGTLCSKSSTASSHISDHSKASTLQQQLPNKSNMFLLNELNSQQQQLNNNQDYTCSNESPPPPAPQFQPNPNQRIFTTSSINSNNQTVNNGYNVYESTYDSSNLYGGLNRVHLSARQHHTLNTRQLNNQQQRKANQVRPTHNRVLDFIELNGSLNGSTNSATNQQQQHQMNLIANPLHHNNSLQGSLPSLVNQQQDNPQPQLFTNKKTMPTNHPSGKLQNRIPHPNQLNTNLHSSLNRSNTSLIDESSDNFYCDIEEAQRYQSEVHSKLNQKNKLIQNRYLSNDQDSGDENGDLISENDKLINRDENKLIIRHQLQEDEDNELTDQYSDYECIDRIQTSNQFVPNSYLRPPQPSGFSKLTAFNNFNNNQRLTPVTSAPSNEVKPARQFNLSLARKNAQLTSNQFNTNSQTGLFRFKDTNTFNTMQTNNRMR